MSPLYKVGLECVLFFSRLFPVNTGTPVDTIWLYSMSVLISYTSLVLALSID